jgi:hypothetical protein
MELVSRVPYLIYFIICFKIGIYAGPVPFYQPFLSILYSIEFISLDYLYMPNEKKIKSYETG